MLKTSASSIPFGEDDARRSRSARIRLPSPGAGRPLPIVGRPANAAEQYVVVIRSSITLPPVIEIRFESHMAPIALIGHAQRGVAGMLL